MENMKFLIIILSFPSLIGVYMIWQNRAVIEYVLQFAFLLGAVILLFKKKRPNEENVGEVNSIARKIPDGARAKPSRHVGIPTAKINGTSRKHVVKKDFLSTAPGKKRVKASTNENSAVAKAVRENIRLIENDLKVVESSLLDELEGYLSEEDVNRMKESSRKDQAHLFAETVGEYDEDSFQKVLEILVKTSFSHISEKLRDSFFKYRPLQSKSPKCSICRIQSEVDIKSIRCGLIHRDLLPTALYKDINKTKTQEGHQNVLWQELFHFLRSLKPKAETAKSFVSVFDIPKHKSLYSFLLRNNLHTNNYDCTCNHRQRLETDQKIPELIQRESSEEESNTSLRESHQNPEWYDDAVNSNSSESDLRSGPLIPETTNSQFIDVKASGRKLRNGRRKRSFEEETLHRFTGRTNLSNQMKRSRNMTQSHVSTTHNRKLEETESETEPKIPYESEKRQGKPVIFVQPYISESDVNSEGEPRKVYTCPRNPVPRPQDAHLSGVCVPNAFAKTNKINGTTQLW